MKNIFAFFRKNISAFFITAISILTASVLVIRICILSSSFADLINSTLAHYYRRALAAVSDILPFSLFEIVILLIPIFITVLVIGAVRAFKASRGIRYIFSLLGIISLIYSG